MRDAGFAFFDALREAQSVDAAMSAFDRVARGMGAVSTSYGYTVGGLKQPGWSSTPAAWRERYWSADLLGTDPEFRPDGRPERDTLIRLADRLAAPDTDADAGRLYGALLEFGFTGVIHMPDRTPAGLREMATINVMLSLPHETLADWYETRGATLVLMGSALHSRLRAIRGVPDPDACLLTSREIEVLSALAQGLRPARIADRLDISRKTVEFHIANARTKLYARTREQAVATASRLGWLERPDG